MRNHERWMRLALHQARHAPHPRWRVGAALVRGGSLYGVSTNRYRNDPRTEPHSGVSWHAEEMLLRQCDDAAGATLYVARVTKTGRIGMARPCSRCFPLIAEAGLKRVCWTTDYGTVDYMNVSDMEYLYDLSA